MLTPRTTHILAVVAAALAATAIANWQRNDAETPTSNMPVERADVGGGTDAQAAHLPGLFVEEKLAAPIEPLPPQF